MKPIFVISLLLSLLDAPAQKVIIKEIRLLPNARYYNVKDTTIIYPVIVTKNKAINKLINDRIREEELPPAPGEEKLSTRKALINRVAEGTITIDYTATYSKNNILSINIFSEDCGVYCSSTYDYFNFDINTGKEISIEDIILPARLDSFKKMVLNDKIKTLTKYKKEEKKILKSHNLDDEGYSWIVQEVDDNCINSVDIAHFSLSNNSITIQNPCEFPHAIRAEEPTLNLEYHYASLAAFLTPAFKKLLFKKSLL